MLLPPAAAAASAERLSLLSATTIHRRCILPPDPHLAQESLSSKGYYATVLDVATLLHAPLSKPMLVPEFIASKQQISHLVTDFTCCASEGWPSDADIPY